MSTTMQEVEQAYTTICQWISDNSALSPGEVSNVSESGVRIAKGFGQMILTREGLLRELRDIFSVRFPTDTTAPQLVMQSGIKAISLCPHHLLPIECVVHMGYVTTPGRYVIGLSKFVRIVQTLAKRAVIQETLTQDLVDVMRLGKVGIERVDVQEVPQRRANDNYQTLGSVIARAIDAEQEGEVKPPAPLHHVTKVMHNIGEPVSDHVGVVVNASHGCMSCRGVMSPSRTHTSLFTGLLSSPMWKNDFMAGIEETERRS